jgi:hypothetical protein
MAKKKKFKPTKIFLWTFLAYKFIMTIPFYILKAIVITTKKSKEKIAKKKIKKLRASIKPKYEKFDLIEKKSGSLEDWENHLENSDSTIGIILGARGTGKSALAIKIFENLHNKKGKKLYAIGFKSEEMPSWVETIDSIDQITNNSHILIDEGGILFSSRSAMSKPNKLLSELLLIARHKNLSILFISQNSSNLEVNILRQADHLLLKPSSLLQKNFERKIIKDIYEATEKDFEKHKTNPGITYIHSEKFQGFISNPLPSFWNTALSKSWNEKTTQ